MDEILIEEKKYVSSKRAAKITGYAKDYIGQLCREGRVPARLVGRSWYVLETAIQDHRFGTTHSQENLEPPPQYEASSEDPIPPLNRLLLEENDEGPIEEDIERHNIESQLENSWKAWFDQVADTTNTSLPEATIEGTEDKKEEEEEKDEGGVEINVPIHTVYELPNEESPSRQHPAEAELTAYKEQEIPEERAIRQWENKGFVRTIQTASVLFAVVAVTLAALGSGYLDEYIISNSQVRMMAGIELYNK